MKALRTVFHAAFAALLCAVAVGGHGIMPAPIVASGGAPSAVTDSYANQGSVLCTNNSGNSGCDTGTVDLYWTASASGSPTDYPIYNNGTQVADPSAASACSGSSCHWTLTGITGMNCSIGPCQETANVIGIYANNASGLSPINYPGNYLYNNGTTARGNSCASYSGGGMSSYMSNAIQISTTNGSHIVTVTTASSTVFDLDGFIDAMGAIPQGAVNNGAGNPYFEVYGTGSTSGTGSTGTYYSSVAATATVTLDDIWANQGPVGTGGGPETCPQSQVVESPHTFAMATYGQGYIQQFAASPMAPGADANWGGYTYHRIDLQLTTNTYNLYDEIHSRPGAGASYTADLFSNRDVYILNGTTSSYGTGCGIGVWCTLKIPLSLLGIGSGTWSGYVDPHWQGTASVSGTTLTIQTTTSGNAANITTNDILVFYSTSTSGFGYPCAQATAPESGGTVAIGGCPGFGTPSWTGNVTGYDVQAYVQTILSGVGPDNAGKITGQGEPTATYFSGTNAGFNTPNTTNGTGHYGLFNLSGSTIVSAGTGSGGVCTTGCVTFGSNRYDAYKPAIQANQGGSGPFYIDYDGAVVN